MRGVPSGGMITLMNLYQIVRNSRLMISHKKQFLKMTVPVLYLKAYLSKISVDNMCSDEEANCKIKDYCGYVNKEDPIMGVTLYNGDDIPIIDLSLIIPVYNAKNYVQKCLNSVISQETKYRFEVIVINDGSTDGTDKVLLEYKNFPNIKVFNQDNKGISATRNKGIEYARGTYIGFIDNDDFIERDYVEKLLDIAYENNADYVKCGYCKFDKDGILTENIVKKSGERNPLLTYDGFIWGGIIRRSLFNNISFPNGYWYEDIITKFIIMRMIKTFCYVDEPLYMYYVHPGNASVTVWRSDPKKCTDQYFLVDFLCRYSKKLGLEEDDNFKELVMHELGEMLWERTKGVPDEIRKAIFVKACTLIDTYVGTTYTPKKLDDKLLFDSFKNRKYKEWKAVSHLRKNKG